MTLTLVAISSLTGKKNMFNEFNRFVLFVLFYLLDNRNAKELLYDLHSTFRIKMQNTTLI